MSDNKETPRHIGTVRYSPDDYECIVDWEGKPPPLGTKLYVDQQVLPVEHDNSELASMTRMFHAACADLGLINEALGLDPNDGGAGPILDAIEELKTAAASQAPAVDADDRDLDAHLIDRMSKLLAEIALVLNSESAPLMRPSYHDLPGKVRALQCEVELLRAKAMPAVEAGARDEREAFEAFGFPFSDLSRSEYDPVRYANASVDLAWDAWQARAALARAAAKGESDEQ